MSLGFTHHMEILSRTKGVDERIFNVHECAERAFKDNYLFDFIWIKSSMKKCIENMEKDIYNGDVK